MAHEQAAYQQDFALVRRAGAGAPQRRCRPINTPDPFDWDNVAEEIEALLDDSPSLGREAAGMLTWAMPRARWNVIGSLADYGEQPAIGVDEFSYTEEQVLGDWVPRA